ncbi:hypothetical protein CEXT_155521 [Caerostris extrusa]|uniref:Uncharacterized protein n=1 Tax=Caerostris extrusa TaxID=172846 RepID=A0AAV4XCI0_CAEEX|nr:hypothetical protein CEXT_155521 [Caerostris extrusa]
MAPVCEKCLFLTFSGMLVENASGIHQDGNLWEVTESCWTEMDRFLGFLSLSHDFLTLLRRNQIVREYAFVTYLNELCALWAMK